MKKIRILFIDSSRDIREKIEYLLKRENDFEVEVGDDAVLAISGAKEKKFDCIIIDTSKCDYNGLFFEDREGNQMDFLERNGVEAILDIKKINPKQKVIALTTNPF
ncbi:MAG: response regulator, partial [Candidatus Pacebacteria bacterium]|nr:response regulator [Candidatus Paceibacterota bacterium]